MNGACIRNNICSLGWRLPACKVCVGKIKEPAWTGITGYVYDDFQARQSTLDHASLTAGFCRKQIPRHGNAGNVFVAMPLKDKCGWCRSRQDNLLTIVSLTPEKKERERQRIALPWGSPSQPSEISGPRIACGVCLMQRLPVTATRYPWCQGAGLGEWCWY